MSVVHADTGPVAPASHMGFEVTVGKDTDTAAQLDRMLAAMKGRAPEAEFIIQEINVSGAVFTGGDPVHLGHNRALALRNEAYVRQHFILAGVRPERGMNPHGGDGVPGVAAPAQDGARRNAVRVDIVYRRRAASQPARDVAGKASRCAKTATAAPAPSLPEPGLRALSAPPPMALPAGTRATGSAVAGSVVSMEKPWLRRCPARPRA